MRVVDESRDRSQCACRRHHDEKELARYLNRGADILANVGLGNLLRNLLGSTLSNVEAAEAAQNMSRRK